ncbi:HNH endonuclease signature motif containing protein [Methylobacterium gnaphalii]|nr:HNH endonuclease signature motif containing protein [Methylobacterium gnaphalii]
MGRLSTLATRLSTLDTRTARPAPKVADPELLTAEHKAWRLEVFKRAHWRCQWPGCGKQGGRGGIRLYADHIVERRDGGAPLDPANGQALCPKHHQVKTAQARAERMSR